MEIDEMRNKSEQDINDHIADLRREQFSLRMQKAQGQNAQTHQFARVRREIARAATVLGEKKTHGAA
ncbi:MAG: 50S ribosomal protein L29 [Rhodanobacteraceae bacterium]